MLEFIKNRLLRFVFPGQECQDGVVPPGTNGLRPVVLPVAGVMYGKRSQTILKCTLKERVFLQREPDNRYDKNAIAVLNKHRQKIGYVRRAIAGQMASLLDAGVDRYQAIITGLACDVDGSVIGVKIGLYVPEHLASRIGVCNHNLEFCYDKGATGAVYLLLNCDEVILHEIIHRLPENGLDVLRFGISYHESLNGRYFQWYIVLEDGVSEEQVKHFFLDCFGVNPDATEETVKFNDWVENFDAENKSLKDENERLRKWAEELHCRLIQAQGRVAEMNPHAGMEGEQGFRSRKDNQFMDVVEIFLPAFEFLRDSADVISRELRDCRPVLHILHSISQEPGRIRATGLKGTNGWKELHFNTGQKDNGRLYYKQNIEKWLTLVSFKNAQERDVRYLQKH